MTLARGLFRDDRASAAAEMALILPAVAFVLLNVVDFSVYVYTRMEDDMEAAAESTSLGASVSIGGTLEDRYCATSGGELVAVDDSAADCSGTLTGSTAVPGYYISTTATYCFSPVFPGASVASVLPATIARTAFMRIQ